MESKAYPEIDDTAKTDEVQLSVIRLTYVKEFANVDECDDATKGISKFVSKVLGKETFEQILRVKATACYKDVEEAVARCRR